MLRVTRLQLQPREPRPPYAMMPDRHRLVVCPLHQVSLHCEVEQKFTYSTTQRTSIGCPARSPRRLVPKRKVAQTPRSNTTYERLSGHRRLLLV
jgi:hypothetical protein